VEGFGVVQLESQNSKSGTVCEWGSSSVPLCVNQRVVKRPVYVSRR